MKTEIMNVLLAAQKVLNEGEWEITSPIRLSGDDWGVWMKVGDRIKIEFERKRLVLFEKYQRIWKDGEKLVREELFHVVLNEHLASVRGIIKPAV